MRPIPLALLLLTTLLLPRGAAAFCGFFVAGSDAALRNSASQVVLLRRDNRTVMTMSNNYQGPPQDFAMVVPVPVVLKKEQVKTLEPQLLQRIEQLSAPRLVEYWEQDPCAPQPPMGSIGLGGIGTIGRGYGSGGIGYGRGYGVVIEARFAVGEYEVLILSAKESDGLEAWLRDHHYRIPKGAAEALAPYIRDQMKFFVAKVDISKVKRDAQGAVVLSPLRFSYESPELRLPVRLGLLNASGKQDLLVYILHPTARFEVANYPNLFIPTNVEVADEVRKDFPAFYAELFDETLARHGGRAVVTEYAWDTRSCDPCPTPPLRDSDLATLGDDPGVGAARSLLTMGPLQASGPLDPELLRRIARRHANELRFCHEQQLASDPTVSGALTLDFAVSPSGQATPAAGKASGAAALVEACAIRALQRWEFPRNSAVTQVRMTLNLQVGRESARGFGGGRSFVLTRLHTRYDPSALSEDLLFRGAKSVLGGRANWDGSLGDQGAQVVDQGPNQFQGRYVIRHYWEKAVSCKEPRYGVWGGPPSDQSRLEEGPTGLGAAKKASAALGIASAPRGKVKLAALVRSPLPELGLQPRPRPLRKGEKKQP